MISFHGELAQSFPPVDLAYKSIADAMSSVERIYPTLRSRIIEQSRQGVGYQILVDGKEIDKDELSFALPSNVDIDIYPIVTGASTTVKIIAGVALLATGVGGIGVLGLSATSVALLGGSLLFSALYKAPSPENNDVNDPKSFAFSSGLNTDKSGSPAPLIVGKTLVGSIVVSYRISSEYLRLDVPTNNPQYSPPYVEEPNLEDGPSEQGQG